MPIPPLQPVRRIVTTHNKQGRAAVSGDTLIINESLLNGPNSVPIWSSDEHPADVSTYNGKAPAVREFLSNGSIFRVVDLPPRSVGALHRSISLDYAIVQQGTVILTLDNGSRTTVNKGDVVIQQATMHGWDNESNEWARIFAIMLPAKAPVIDGKELQNDLSALFGTAT